MVIKNILNKIDNPRITSISGLDAAFLYAETPTSPMHVGSVAVIEGSLKFDTFRALLQSRIHKIPTLRKRLMWVPLSMDYPYWVDDPHFNIDLHLQHVALPRPGSWKELRSMASQIFSEPLDRSRPLWQFTFVEGLDNVTAVPSGSVAIISKMHHVAIDGMAGAGMLSLIFDLSPETKELPPPKPFKPRPLPNEAELLSKSALEFAKNPLRLPKIVGETVKATVKAGVLTRMQGVDLPTAPFSAPATSLNGIISAQRKWNAAVLSLERVKTLKNIMGTTLNDIVLTICSGALRRYLLEKNQLPSKPLVAMIPISVRSKEAEGQSMGGNQLSNMLVQLSTHIENPLERLEHIYEHTLKGKTYQGAIGAKTLSNLAEVIPFGVANQASRLYSRYSLSKLHKPVFNVVITNVPGPNVPIYMHGHQLLSVMGMAPVIDGMGLIITIFSYNGLLTISATSDAKSMPDIDIFTRYIRESANELEDHVLQYQKEQEKKKPTKLSLDSDKLFDHLKVAFADNATHIKPNNGKFQFKILKGDDIGLWSINLDGSPGVVKRGKISSPDAVFTVNDDHLLKIGTGELDFQTAFVQGRISLVGDMAKAMKLSTILTKLPKLTSL